MSKTIAIVGYGPGTATAVAEKFGKQGFSVALIGRDQNHLAAGVSALKALGIGAHAFTGDAGDPASIRDTIKNVRSQAGPITVLHWNAYGALDVGDLFGADQKALNHVFDVAVFGLLAAAEEALPDLKQSGDGAIMVSNGALGVISPDLDQAAVGGHVMGLALSSGAKHKLVGLLAQRLKGEGVFVGEVTVYRQIKGTPGAGDGAVDPSVIAEKHWALYQARSETRDTVK